jgi:OPA family glycerol-3-phosphate transporter-like MFS transporter 1/2
MLKLTNYGIMYWIPKYCEEILEMSKHQSTNIATLYDVGTLAGGMILGFITDKTPGSKRSPVMVTSLMLATIGHVFLIFITVETRNWMYLLIIILGFFVGAISNILCSTCVADIGKKASV